MRNFLTFDIGGTLIKYGVLTETGQFVTKNEHLTDAYLGGKEVLNKVKMLGKELMNDHTISGICISTAGQVDSKKGVILYASEIIPEYTGIHVKQELEDFFGLPVGVENDVNCVGLAESWIGKGKDAKSMFCLTIGTGIGGSYVVDNQLHTGHHFSGGEIGYIPIEGEEFQELAATKTLIENVAKRKNCTTSELDGKKIFEMAQHDDQICIEEINRLIYYLSKGIATIIYIMNPEMLVIGGGITNQKEFLHPLIMKQLEKDVIPAILQKTKIEIAGNLNDAGMIGALRHFLLQESLQPFNKITTMMESNKHKLTNGEKTIAKYITMNLTDVPNHTISQMANKINVSESMITRFCKKLNIGSYSQLRLMAKEALVGNRIHDKSEANSLIKIKQDYFNILDKIETLNQNKEMLQIMQAIMSAKYIFLLGNEELALIMNQIKYRIMTLGIPVDVFSSTYQLNISSNLDRKQSVVIGLSISGHDKEIIEFLKTAKIEGATTIGITSQKGSPVLENTNLSLYIPDDSGIGTHSIREISILYLIDTLFQELDMIVDQHESNV
ncbi:ROK family protein [Gracilibacillus timonensis]|uniref:ROK family protein n=1 Tax=Gracilibacillus timonensis TaxID=1816696 RepID=UPI0008241E12|nr:ROK family protein [Gracilibacillus timonensis]